MVRAGVVVGFAVAVAEAAAVAVVVGEADPVSRLG